MQKCTGRLEESPGKAANRVDGYGKSPVDIQTEGIAQL